MYVIPFPGEDEESDEDADLNKFIRGELRMVGGSGVAPLDSGKLPATETCVKILEQRTNHFCQTFLASAARHDILCLESEEGNLCHRHLRDQDIVHVLLSGTLLARVLSLAHHRPFADHPGQTRLVNRLRKVYYWP